MLYSSIKKMNISLLQRIQVEMELQTSQELGSQMTIDQ